MKSTPRVQDILSSVAGKAQEVAAPSNVDGQNSSHCLKKREGQLVALLKNSLA